MSDHSAPEPAQRSEASLLFQSVLFAARGAGFAPRLADVEFARLRKYEPWISIIDVDIVARALRFEAPGAALSALAGRDLMGANYLEVVDPPFRDVAYDSVLLMLGRPCGLWQMTPAVGDDGAAARIECTGIPVFDDKGRGKIMFLAQHPNGGASILKQIAQINHATEWRWIEMRDGEGEAGA
jgi:hypothetical protein